MVFYLKLIVGDRQFINKMNGIQQVCHKSLGKLGVTILYELLEVFNVQMENKFLLVSCQFIWLL